MEANNIEIVEGNKKKITLPSGNWVIFKDPMTLKVKDRKKVFKNADGQEGVLQALSLVDGMLAILIESWSFEFPIPMIKISMLDELTMGDYDKLSNEVGEAQKILFPALNQTPETEKDDDSPFGKSNA